jgi:quercetin dioxygenase-like cupin family protein
VRSTLFALLLGFGSSVFAADPPFRLELPNVPGKSFVAVVVEYPPGGKSPSHRHAPSAFIYAYVLSGSIRSQVDDGPKRVYREGESFHELPGAHHRVSENASQTAPARMLAIFVVDTNEKPLTIPDAN